MTCPHCKVLLPDGVPGAAEKCVRCGHWFYVPLVEAQPTLMICQTCGRKVDPVHIVGHGCVVCSFPGP